MAVEKKTRTPSRFATRAFLKEALAQRDFDAIDEFVKLYRSCEEEASKVKLIALTWEFQFAKPRPSDQEGDEDKPQVIILTPEMIAQAVKAGRGES